MGEPSKGSRNKLGLGLMEKVRLEAPRKTKVTKETFNNMKTKGARKHSLYSVPPTNMKNERRISKIRGLVRRRKEAGRRMKNEE